jgi:hypothetical protein
MAKSTTSFKKGKSGNPGGRAKANADVQDLCRAETEANVKKLINLRDTDGTPAPVIVAAIKEMMDRAWCKPPQTVNQNIKDKRIALDWNTSELVEEIRKRRAAGDRAAEARGSD